mmetsp:Transcript_66719/g.192748  ORF Transcript_66719/g.192748 Transcript_66719/m.192748 type:complete len:210 (+) Transcript_66719:682-1311(+)
MVLMSFSPRALTLAQPFSPMLPLPSKTMTMSNFEVHLSVSPLGLHACWLQRRYCNRTSESGFAQVPWPFASVATFRLRSWKPPSQALEQRDHRVHCDRSQSRSQAALLQTALSDVASQGRPPPLGCRRTVRTRSLMPPPHWALQELQPPQDSRAQSLGQGCSLHRRCITSGGQAAPRLAGTTTERTIFCVPPPQGALHSSGIHGDTSQS